MLLGKKRISTILHLPKCFFWLRFCAEIPAPQGTPHPNGGTNPHFMVDYLISHLGFSQERASRASKYFPYLKSIDKPQSVLRFLRDQGFTHAHITKIVAVYPKLLSCSVDTTLLPNMNSLLATGRPKNVIHQIITANPEALHIRGVASRLSFWHSFFGNDDSSLLRGFKSNRNILAHDINTSIAPKLALLKDLGFPSDSIRLMASRSFICNSLETMKSQLKQTEQMGFSRCSKMFVYGLLTITKVSKKNLAKKMELFRGMGWSEKDLLSAVLKAPNILQLSESNIRTKMDFFVGLIGLQPSFVAAHPILVLLSLEKRLRPRYIILQILKSGNFTRADWSVSSIMMQTEKKFVEKFIVKYQSQFPDLHLTYSAACNKKTLDLCLTK